MDIHYIRLDVSINIIAAHSMFLLLILHIRFMMLDKYKASCQPILSAFTLHFKATKLAPCIRSDNSNSDSDSEVSLPSLTLPFNFRERHNNLRVVPTWPP